MKAIINPSFLKGQIAIPPSKSVTQRAFAAALLKGGESCIYNAGNSDDEETALDIISRLGATVAREKDCIRINSNGINVKNNQIDCRESGLSLRLFTPIASLSGQQMIINGQGSLLNRPIGFFEKTLPLLDVSCTTTHGKLPLVVKGPMVPADITIDGSLSSQFLTGLLFAYSAAGARGKTITVSNLASRPYIDITLKVLSAFGMDLPVNNNYQSFYFNGHRPVNSEKPVSFFVEGDWSSAAFLLVAGAVSGDLELTGLDVFSAQADKNVLQPLMQSGCTISIEEKRIAVKKSRLKAFHFNAVDCPDLFPPLVALACYCEGTSVIEGIHRLIHKESNRAVALVEEFTKMGIEIFLQDDLMVIRGGKVQPATVHAHGDHRIAMACSIAALGAEGVVQIDNAESINKSYPGFYDHLSSAGADLSLMS